MSSSNSTTGDTGCFYSPDDGKIVVTYSSRQFEVGKGLSFDLATKQLIASMALGQLITNPRIECKSLIEAVVAQICAVVHTLSNFESEMYRKIATSCYREARSNRPQIAQWLVEL